MESLERGRVVLDRLTEPRLCLAGPEGPGAWQRCRAVLIGDLNRKVVPVALGYSARRPEIDPDLSNTELERCHN
jgi:hypothetical protein